jgi:alkylation response protein AidB-like acyl-CoA dehydrogenase
VYNKDFYYELLTVAQQDLSKAHLLQHFTTAQSYITAFGLSMDGTGTFSAQKSNDTLVFNNGKLTGKKHWVSGVEQCDWVLVGVRDAKDSLFVVVDKKDIASAPVLTQGMEGTVTVHFTCDQASACVLGRGSDPRWFSADQNHKWYFVTNQLGLAMAVFKDIDRYTSGPTFKYTTYSKNKIRLDLEILNLLWTNEINQVGNQPWDVVYAFAKKVITQVAQLVIEITGNGLYEIDQPAHQRFQDILIYSVHMRNVGPAINDIQQWSV